MPIFPIVPIYPTLCGHRSRLIFTLLAYSPSTPKVYATIHLNKNVRFILLIHLTHFLQSKSHDTYHLHTAFIFSLILQQMLLHFSIIFFLLYLVEKIISVFSSPLLCVFYVPVVSLYLPIRHLVLHRKRWYVPNKSVVRLCRVVAII